MFQDSQDETVVRMRKKFEDWNGGGGKIDGVAMQVQVLNECFWPLSMADKIHIAVLPSEFANCVQKFDQFYKSDTQNRKLKWIFTHGSVQINVNIKGKMMQFVVSPVQACILLCFNNTESMTFQEIYNALWPSGAAATNALHMSGNAAQAAEVKLDDQLRTAMGPFISASQNPFKIKVLVQGPEEKEVIKMTDTFTLMAKVPPLKRKRLVFPAGNAVQKAVQDTEEDRAAIMKQREFEADAAMVRVMKTRNVLKWNELVIQTVDSLKARFKPEPVLLKKRLESLIDRKFLERDPNDRNVIKYVA